MAQTKYLQVMIVGGGGREHALAWRLSKSPSVDHIYVVPGNAGISSMGVSVTNIDNIDVEDFPALVSLGMRLRIELAVIGLDSTIVAGISEHSKEEIVVKADGLAAGKGVFLPATKEEAVTVLREILVDGKFGCSGELIVIEEFLDGQEISVSTLSDGHHTINLLVGQDHKRILDDDQGPNTGGMGVYAPVPCATAEALDQIERTILQPTFEGFHKRGYPFEGLLFTGIMLTKNGPKVLGYNARFGDPETQSVLPLIDPKVDLASVFLACTQGNLRDVKILLSSRYACNIVITSRGYPNDFRKGEAVTFGPVP